MIDIYFFLVGSILASFLGLVIDRFPEQSIISSASHCDSCQTRLHPLLVWMTFHLILIASSGWNLVMVSFLILGILAHFIDIRMGAGDFLFLASCALVFSVTELLILIQFASTTGILAFLLQKKKERLPFVPFLLLATCLIIFGKLLLV